MSDSITLKSITAYRAGETEGTIDFDELPAAILDVPARYNDHQFTQELQLLYTSDKIQAVAGVFYLNATAAGAFDTVVSQANLTIATAGHVDTESWSGYADVSYSVTDALKVSVGGRYTRDEKTGQVYRQNFTGLKSPLFSNTLAIPGLVRSNFTNSKTFDKFTPRVSVSYDVNPDMTGYVSYSQGFKSGGFDMRADAILTPTSVNGYEPESVDSYEAGLKGYFFDRRLSLNSAVFYAKYKDQQITQQTPVGASIASQVLNVGKSHMSGAEIEGVASLLPNLTANFSLGYIKAEFDEYRALDLTSTPPVVRDFADVRVFQNTPEWTGSVSFTYTADLGDHGRITFTPVASYRDSFHMFEIPSQLDQSSYWLVDASLVWTSASDRYRVGLHGKNLTDETYRIGGYNFPQSAGVPVRQLGERLLRPPADGAADARSEVLEADAPGSSVSRAVSLSEPHPSRQPQARAMRYAIRPGLGISVDERPAFHRRRLKAAQRLADQRQIRSSMNSGLPFGRRCPI
jgi:iron complex outermembrane receptor protein